MEELADFGQAAGVRNGAAEALPGQSIRQSRPGLYSTKYFHCFPTSKNFYADPIFTTNPDNILLFTTVCPGGKAGR